jgi:proteic killer suppression protein
MRVVFRDARLAVIRTADAAQTGLPAPVIKSCQTKLVVLDAAPDERTLRNWKSLHYEKLKGDREGQRSIRLNDRWRLVFSLDESTSPPTIVVLSVEDYH